MPDLRDKFVFNVQKEGRLDTPETEHFVFDEPVARYPDHSLRNPSLGTVSLDQQFHNANSYNSKETLDLPYPHTKPYPPLPKDQRLPYGQNYPNTASNYEMHEMLRLPSNPFQDNQRGELRENPFTSPLELPLAPANYDEYPQNMAHEDSEDDAFKEGHQKLLRRQERNRRKLETRLPRFHWTKLPWFTILVTLIQVIVFIVELARMATYTGSPFQTKPYFNPMLGPSTYLLISMGARYVPCMHRINNITLDLLIQYPCPNSTSLATDVCNLAELCSLGGIPIVNDEYAPDQWYRVITPIFLHAGFLHILFNLLLQVSMGWSVEKAIGWVKYSIIYLASGVAGFLLGANFSPNGIASTGASGALFGIIATNLLLFVYCGKENTNIYNTKHYKSFIIVMVLEVVVLFVLGLLPGLDNFSHIGGFCMGLLVSIMLLRDPSFVYNEGIYVYDPNATPMQLFVNNWNPMHNWQHKVPWKVMAWGGVRVVCLTLAILFFALLFVNLYSKRMQSETPTCSWCKYLSCLPVNGWCDQGQVTVETIDSNGNPTNSDSSSATSTSSAAAATSSLPLSIDNPNNKRELQFETFSAPEYSGPSLGPPSFPQNHPEVNIMLLCVMAALSYRFIRRLYK